MLSTPSLWTAHSGSSGTLATGPNEFSQVNTDTLALFQRDGYDVLPTASITRCGSSRLQLHRSRGLKLAKLTMELL